MHVTRTRIKGAFSTKITSLSENLIRDSNQSTMTALDGEPQRRPSLPQQKASGNAKQAIHPSIRVTFYNYLLVPKLPPKYHYI